MHRLISEHAKEQKFEALFLTLHYECVKHKVSNPSRKMREMDTQFKVKQIKGGAELILLSAFLKVSYLLRSMKHFSCVCNITALIV